MSERTDILERLKVEKSPAIKRLSMSLMKYNIVYKDIDNLLDNVVFSRGERKYKCAHEMFFRYTGQCVFMNSKGEIEYLTDDKFYDWLKMYILVSLGVNKI